MKYARKSNSHIKSALIGSTLAMMILFWVSTGLAMTEHWYIGGTLQRASLEQWQQATHENKLATAATWALSQPGIRNIGRQSRTMNSVRPYAEELVGCIDKDSKTAAGGKLHVSGLAAECMIMLGW